MSGIYVQIYLNIRKSAVFIIRKITGKYLYQIVDVIVAFWNYVGFSMYLSTETQSVNLLIKQKCQKQSI